VPRTQLFSSFTTDKDKMASPNRADEHQLKESTTKWRFSESIGARLQRSCIGRRCVSCLPASPVCDPYGGRVGGCCNPRRWTLSWDVCGTRCTKIFLVVINFIFLVCGLTSMAVGVLMYADANGESFFYWKLLDGFPMVGPLVADDRLPLILVAVGSFVALISFLGCCGACEDSVCFLCIYTLLLLGVLLAQIVVSVVMAVCREQIVRQTESALQYQITYEYNRTALPSNQSSAETKRITAAWDIMQIELNCCGATGPQDYQYSVWFNHTKNTEGVFVPLSCCVMDDNDPRPLVVKDVNRCQIDAILYPDIVSHSLKYQGCQKAFIRWLRSRILIVVTIVSALTILQILHLVFACVLLTSLRRSHSDCRWYEDDYG
jgi:hypothetical protein